MSLNAIFFNQGILFHIFRVIPREAVGGHPAAYERAMFLNGLIAVVGTGGIESTAGTIGRADEFLIYVITVFKPLVPKFFPE